MNKGECSIEGCFKPARKRGWCSMHYWRWGTYGDPHFVKSERYDDPELAFAARTERRGDCLVWTGATYPSGYGQLRINNKVVRAHRYAWERANGPIPEGMVIDHMCFNRACVNVNHLRVGTDSLNKQNLAGARKHSSTGIRGVALHKKSGLWSSTVTVGGRRHTKYSKTIEEAERKVIAMRRELMPFSQEPQEES